MKLQIRFHECDTTLTGEGPTLLAALGKIDEQVNAIFGASLVDDGVFADEMGQALETLTESAEFARLDFSCPEQDFTLTVLSR